jgi:crotonobetainyl-CoA:carnitine CoA-transferase CaiB-like acyl-CoA transferase
MSVLAPYRVLDLTNERGLLCGQILGDLGADVVKVEPVGGDPARTIPPFLGDVPDPARSLYWWAYNRNKRSITLNLESAGGREILIRMLERADFLIESFDPGRMNQLGLGYDALAARNPALVQVSITAFGSDGPKAMYADADLIIMAAGGPLILAGDDDRPPVRLGVPQAYLHASADGAVAAMACHHERIRSGRGQRAEVAAIQSVAIATQAYILAAPLGSAEARRMSGGVKFGPINIPLVWPARDGFIACTFLFGNALGPFSRKLMGYICEQGFCDAATRDKDWIAYGEMLFDGREPLSEFERVINVVRAFTGSRTKAELLQLAVEKGFLMTPLTTIEEVVQSPQLASRKYFQRLEHPELGKSFEYPGPFVKFSATPIEYRRRPPLAGEHNREIYSGELGFAEAELSGLAARGII